MVIYITCNRCLDYVLVANNQLQIKCAVSESFLLWTAVVQCIEMNQYLCRCI